MEISEGIEELSNANARETKIVARLSCRSVPRMMVSVSPIPNPPPSRRIVTRLPVGREVQPWPSDQVRYIRNRWRGPLHMRVGGADFHLRYVAFHEHSGEGVYPLHFHPHMELMLTDEGGGVVERADGERFEMKPGCALLMLPRSPHFTVWGRDASPWSLFIADFDLAIDAEQIPFESNDPVDPAFTPFYEWFVVRRQPLLPLRPRDWDGVREILRGVRPHLAQSQYGVGSEMLAAMLRLITLLSRSLREQGLAMGRNILPPQASPEAALLNARAQLESRVIYDPGNVQRLARAAGYSEAHFIRAFRAAFGVTPKHYAQKLLMRRASGLLLQTDLPVREIAYRLGFEEPSLFSRAFRRAIGSSPEPFRRERRACPE